MPMLILMRTEGVGCVGRMRLPPPSPPHKLSVSILVGCVPWRLSIRVMSPTCGHRHPAARSPLQYAASVFKHIFLLRFYKKQMFLSPGNQHMKHISASLSVLRRPGNIIICDENGASTDSPAPRRQWPAEPMRRKKGS